MDLNRSTLLGRLTQDLELKQTPGGKYVVSTSMVTNEVFTDQAGQKQENADFHNLVIWGKLAENLEKYAKKGSRIYVEGKLKTRTWDKDDGTKAYRTEVLVSSFILLDSKGNAQSTPSETKKTEPQQEEITVEDIPF